MDSLLATYASSDEEDDHHQQQQEQQEPQKPTTQSKVSSLFSSLPKPYSLNQQEQSEKQQDPKPNPKGSALLFSSLPPPKSKPISDSPFSAPNPKRVVQFRPPVPQNSSKSDSDNDEQDDEDERDKKKKRQLVQDPSVKSFLSSMPAPKTSGGSALGSMSGSGRRSTIETDGPGLPGPRPSSSDANEMKDEIGLGGNVADGSHLYNYNNNNDNVGVTGDQSYTIGYEGYGGGYGNTSTTNTTTTEGYDSGYGSYGSYSGGYGNTSTTTTQGYDGSYGSYGNYGGVWNDALLGATMVPETSSSVESFVSMGGKRRKDQPPPEILEVKQDELMKNRPKEEKSKLTGLAFGPSYQPASTKGKPSKLHKRKHQINSLLYDLKSKEMELAERRSKGLLTKAETQAKYGW